MKVMLQVEGPIDRLILKELVERVLAAPVEPVVYRKRVGGIDEVFRTLKNAAWDAWQRGCVGAVLGVDSNGSTPHAGHPQGTLESCRYCRIQKDLPRLPSRPPQPDFKFAVFVPVQAIESWLLHFGHMIGKRAAGPPQAIDRHDAKRLLWGTLTPEEKTVGDVCGGIFPRLQASDLEGLAKAQPSFQDFRDALRTWTT